MKYLGAIGAVVLALTMTAPTMAATLDEGSVPGGRFSGSWATPTAIGTGYDLVTGKGRANQFDNMVFTALPAGAQALTFNFTGAPGNRPAYAAGGTILYSFTPFRWGWDGTTAGTFGLFGSNATDSLTLNLGPSFTGGALYLALNFTFGNNIGYSISVPSNNPPPPPPAVPLPASGLVLAGGLAAAGLALRRKRAR